LKQTIPPPGVEGRIDPFDFDAAGETGAAKLLAEMLKPHLR
jgi:hypothetical protein